MTVQTTRDSRYDYYNTGILFPNWGWYFRKFPDEKTATVSAARDAGRHRPSSRPLDPHWANCDGGVLRKPFTENPLDDLVGTSTLACIHYRIGDLKPAQQIVINKYKGARKGGRSDPSTFKAGMLLTPDFHAKVNWGAAVSQRGSGSSVPRRCSDRAR